MSSIKILALKSETGAGTFGAGLGIDALKIAALNQNSNFFAHHPTEEIPNENKLLFYPVKHPHARFIEGIATLYDRVSKNIKQTLQQKYFPVVLSGTHATAGATIAGIKMAYPEARTGVIWIDAHSDLHTPYTSPSGNMHGMPLATALNIDNFSLGKNRLDAETVEYWNSLKQTGGMAPKIQPEDVILIGLRSFEKEEKALIQKLGIKALRVEDVRKKGADSIGKSSLKHLRSCDLIYLSFDVDCLDPSISRGTGTPVEGGLFKKEAEQLLSALLKSRKLCCLEFTEINPTLDTKNQMAVAAFDLLTVAAAEIEKH